MNPVDSILVNFLAHTTTFTASGRIFFHFFPEKCNLEIKDYFLLQKRTHLFGRTRTVGKLRNLASRDLWEDTMKHPV